MEKEIMEILKEIQKDIAELKAGQQRIEIKVNSIDDKLETLEPANANRHIEIVSQIEELNKNLTNVEIITSSNWNEIAKLKAVK